MGFISELLPECRSVGIFQIKDSFKDYIKIDAISSSKIKAFKDDRFAFHNNI